MTSALRLHASNTAIGRKKWSFHFAGNRTLLSPAASLRLAPPPRKLTVLSLQPPQNAATSSEPSISSEFTSSVGSPPLQSYQFNLTQRNINVLYVAACAVAISTTWLFCSAIPTLLSFKRAAESMEKLMDVTREELPGTMAAVRLSGMEISDLTMELSDLGQEITQGVRSSTRAVRMAEERLRRFANVNSAAPMQEVARIRTSTAEPRLARSARSIKEQIVKSRSVLQMFFTLTSFSKLVINYLSNRSRRKAMNK